MAAFEINTKFLELLVVELGVWVDVCDVGCPVVVDVAVSSSSSSSSLLHAQKKKNRVDRSSIG